MSTSTPAVGSFAALFEASRNLSHDAAPRQMKLSQLEPHPNQPRTFIDPGSLAELAASISSHGLLQPLIVRPHPHNVAGRYQIIAGERRFHACQMAGLESVPVVIRHVDDTNARQMALIENLQREDITPLEEAQVLQQILHETQWSHRQLGEKIGKSKTYVEQRVRLLRYPAEIQTALAANTRAFHPGHAKAVVQLTDPLARERLIADIQTKELSVREVEQRVARARAKISTATPAATTPAAPVMLESLAVVNLLRPLLERGETTTDAQSLLQAMRNDIQRLTKAERKLETQ